MPEPLRAVPSFAFLADEGESALASSEFIFGETPFFFLRHGETVENETGIVQGQNDTELSDLGRKTAERAGLILPGLGIRSIYTSPLRRAWETAVISRASLQTPIFTISGLMERYWGIYEGGPKIQRPFDNCHESVESLEDFRERVLDAMEAIRGPSPILVVAHSGVFRVLFEYAGHHMAPSVSVSNSEVLKFSPPEGNRKTWKISMA
jgi:probable phosphoglycerate mutase